jgi:hypothetical protein
MTVAWYRARMQGDDMHAFSMAQIEEYEHRVMAQQTPVAIGSGAAA